MARMNIAERAQAVGMIRADLNQAYCNIVSIWVTFITSYFKIVQAVQIV